MSSPPSATQDDAYAQLIRALHPSPSAVLEIEILPSSFPPRILHESPAVGVPKSLLIPLYLQARETFFGHVSSSHGSDPYRAALQATAVMLLFDPNHLTAANFRKRHIQRFSSDRTVNGHCNDQGPRGLAEAVIYELRFLASLATSPLSKHAKSPTLWAQRLWIVRNFSQLATRVHATDEVIQTMIMRHGIRGFWDGELMIVFKAGERHPRNYYAWQYARQLFSVVHAEQPELMEGRNWNRKMLRDSVGLVHAWCLMYPRDISGWAFLLFLLERLHNECRDQVDKGMGHEDEIRISTLKTKEFARKFEWKGESIEWFLGAIKTLHIDD